MPTRWNIDPQPQAIDHEEGPVLPGDPYDFTAEQIKAGLTGNWSTKDPRIGLSDERVFKTRRDAKANHPTESPTATEPAVSGEEKE